MADRRSEWERRRRAGFDEDDPGGWDRAGTEPRRAEPDDASWREGQRRFGTQDRAPWRPGSDGVRQRSAYTGWAYQGDDERPRRTYWDGNPRDEDGSLRGMSAYRAASGPHSGKGPRGYRRDWGRVRDDVCDLLERDGEIDASDIEVDVHDGIVTLRGTVPDRHQKRRAEHLIDAIPHVRDVHNELRLHRDPPRHGLTVNGTDPGVGPTETH